MRAQKQRQVSMETWLTTQMPSHLGGEKMDCLVGTAGKTGSACTENNIVFLFAVHAR